MYIEVSENGFIQEFENMGRAEQFSYHGLVALFGHLTEMEADLTAGGLGKDSEIELDVIGLCCDFSEYDSALEALSDVDSDHWEYLTDEYSVEIAEERALTELNDNCGTVIEHEDGVIISE